jgi:hypothetical protein
MKRERRVAAIFRGRIGLVIEAMQRNVAIGAMPFDYLFRVTMIQKVNQDEISARIRLKLEKAAPQDRRTDEKRAARNVRRLIERERNARGGCANRADVPFHRPLFESQSGRVMQSREDFNHEQRQSD